ncbi:MAG: DNA repair protein RecN, partial [Opitutales bacterium]|nr:DNA repair protein RecN [Opitutales bacterium]
FLEENSLPPLEDGALILRRIIHKTKSAKCFINGALAPLSAMRELGGLWVDFHGPGEPQKLFSAKCQLEMLDAFGGVCAGKEPYLELLKIRAQSLKKIGEIKSAKRLDPDEIEFLRSRIAEIESFNPDEDSVRELEANFKLLENASAICEKTAASCGAISGENGAMDALGFARRALSEISESSGELASLLSRLDSAMVEISDISADLESISGRSSFTDGEARQIRQRMDAWLSIRRKFGGTVSQALEAKRQMEEKIAMQGDAENAMALELEKISDCERKMSALALKIEKSRRAAARGLSEKVLAMLKKLGFKKPDFKISISAEAEFTPSCGSVCEFEFSANPGSAAQPLAKIASSGELARVMLGVKTAIADADETPLLVFDEVDANVGGEIGAAVGFELANLGAARQVLCVTHLPQVAAFGDSHLLVKKTQSDSETSVEISCLKGGDRVLELARMLGDRNSKSAITHARGLLSARRNK